MRSFASIELREATQSPSLELLFQFTEVNYSRTDQRARFVFRPVCGPELCGRSDVPSLAEKREPYDA